MIGHRWDTLGWWGETAAGRAGQVLLNVNTSFWLTWFLISFAYVQQRCKLQRVAFISPSTSRPAPRSLVICSAKEQASPTVLSASPETPKRHCRFQRKWIREAPRASCGQRGELLLQLGGKCQCPQGLPLHRQSDGFSLFNVVTKLIHAMKPINLFPFALQQSYTAT